MGPVLMDRFPDCSDLPAQYLQGRIGCSKGCVLASAAPAPPCHALSCRSFMCL
jgi:hypothetical protein